MLIKNINLDNNDFFVSFIINQNQKGEVVIETKTVETTTKQIISNQRNNLLKGKAQMIVNQIGTSSPRQILAQKKSLLMEIQRKNKVKKMQIKKK